MKFSIIVPAYNAENTIGNAIDNLESLDFDKEQFEIIVVNDGSKDDTFSALKKKKNEYPNLVVKNKQNGGVSSARNFALDYAKGEYILFVDADDGISKNTLTELNKFIEKNKDINIIVYNIKYNSNGRRHWRADYLKKSGVYDAEIFCFGAITTVNFCIKNKFENELRFNTNLIMHEDEDYACRQVLIQNKYGFVKECTYLYNNDNSTSATNTKLNPIYVFDASLKLYKDLLSLKPQSKYIQSLIINDLSWKLRANVLFSEGTKLEEEQKRRVGELLSGINNEVIMDHPNVDKFHKFYFLKLKREKVKIYAEGNRILCKIGKLKEFHVKENLLYLSKIAKTGKSLSISGFYKNYITEFISEKDVDIYICIDDQIRKCIKSYSFFSHHRSKTRTNNFYRFDLKLDPKRDSKFFFIVRVFNNFYKINRVEYKNLHIGDSVKVLDRNSFIRCDKSGNFEYIVSTPRTIQTTLNEVKQIFKKSSAKGLFSFCAELNFLFQNKRICLYSDKEGVLDNAFEQFKYDLSKKDNLKRYYVYWSQKDKENILKKGIKPSRLVKFHSLRHQIYYLNSKYVFTSFVDDNFFVPFGLKNYKENYGRFSTPEIIYLQHGVLHAKTLHYAREFLNIDYVVVSTFNEEKFLTDLGFQEGQILKFGAPRLDRERSAISSTKIKNILYVPSWRSYLGIRSSDNIWGLNREKTLNSKYFICLKELISDRRLQSILKENNIHLDIKLHPIFKELEKELHVRNPISIQDAIKISSYDVIITDYSSIVYDAVYSGKIVIYYCPDYFEYKNGLNMYSDTTVPIENGFGALSKTNDELLEILTRITRDTASYIEKFKEKYESTFFDCGGAKERIYNEFKEI